MKIKENLRPILGVVLLVLLGHFSSVDGCSGGSKESTTDNPATEPPAKDCPEHVCNDNKKCYTHDQQCDGNQDCDDNTDEDAGHCGKFIPQKELKREIQITLQYYVIWSTLPIFVPFYR